MEKRIDDYISRRKKIKNLSDNELYDYFWQLTDRLVNPLLELSKTHTSPSIERSVLLRMGFSSLTSSSIVEFAVKKGLLGKGVGHLVLKYAEIKKIDYLSAGQELSQGNGWDDLINIV